MEKGVNHICTNCGNEFDDNYCGHCGVKKNNGRIYFKDQLHDLLYYVFSLDSPISTTFKGLMTNPGKVGHEYILGKRKKYYTPIKYFILCSAIYFVLVNITGIDPDAEYTSEIIRKYANYYVFLLPPILALFSRLFFFKEQLNYSENLAYCFLITGHFILLNILYIPVLYFLPGSSILSNIFILYVIWGIYSFHKGKFITRLLLSILTVGIAYIVNTALIIGITILILTITNYSFFKNP